MIKEILRCLYVENLSLGETAQELGISSESLKEMIRNMEHMGYVKTIRDDISATCSGCRSCGGTQTLNVENCSITGKKLILTEKGKRMCNRTER
ncbi:FeoC-like transcriptional regulator [Methanolobus sp. ZRKC2]|uniref:FeoC-like transcriptional regulator n=1 Tax=Methanolobus sp. ZRKC2 TaxID=3125783 RepID=UPI0032559E48